MITVNVKAKKKFDPAILEELQAQFDFVRGADFTVNEDKNGFDLVFSNKSYLDLWLVIGAMLRSTRGHDIANFVLDYKEEVECE